MARFYHGSLSKSQTSLHLDATQSHHLVKVLRMREGQQIEVFNGRGLVASCEILETNSKAVSLSISKVEEVLLRHSVQVCFGIPKAAALEFIVRRCTELGVRAFQPLQTEHSLAAKSWNASRWERLLIETAKQCQAAHLPIMSPPLSFRKWLSQRDANHLLIICDESQRFEKPTFKDSPRCDLLIGPEGGWSREERLSMENVSPLALGLGAHRLRAETAALVATSILKYQLGELSEV